MPNYAKPIYDSCARCGRTRELTKFRKELLCPQCLNPKLKPVNLEDFVYRKLDSYMPEPMSYCSVKVVEKLDRGHGNKFKSKQFYVGNKRIS